MQELRAWVVLFRVFDPAVVVEDIEELIQVEAVYTIAMEMRRRRITEKFGGRGL